MQERGTQFAPNLLVKEQVPGAKIGIFQLLAQSLCSLTCSLLRQGSIGRVNHQIFFNHVEADEKSTNFYLESLVGGAIILAQYLQIAPIVIPTLLAQFIAVLVGSIVVDFFNQVEGDKCSSFFLFISICL